jgi:hypothetical protein
MAAKGSNSKFNDRTEKQETERHSEEGQSVGVRKDVCWMEWAPTALPTAKRRIKVGMKIWNVIDGG